MKIETKFSIGDDVFMIFRGSLVSFMVCGMELNNGRVVYLFYPDNIAENPALYKPESECFASIDELCEYYKAKLAK